jgi:EAL domain-containing protein (putative c-di-GMP-specific phosphodiesterase class I)
VDTLKSTSRLCEVEADEVGAIVNAIVVLAHAGIDVTAEGIETINQLRVLMKRAAIGRKAACSPGLCQFRL